MSKILKKLSGTIESPSIIKLALKDTYPVNASYCLTIKDC